MARIIILSSKSRDLSELEQLLKVHMHEVLFAFDKKSLQAVIRYEKPQLIIWDIYSFDKEHLQSARTLRSSGVEIPLLVLANEMNVGIESLLLDLSRSHFMKLPYNQKVLMSLIQKLNQDPNLKKQGHKRFKTNQPLSVEKILTGENYTSNMTNLSKGGACCVFDAQVHLKKGDLTRLNLNLDVLNKDHTLNAQVVWFEYDSFQQKSNVGFKFLNTQDLYRHLLQSE